MRKEMHQVTLQSKHLTDPAAMEADAEVVRAYLVQLRGGAPFLSGADGRLLVRWLEAGVPVAHILYALDKAAERRRKRRQRGKPARSRLTLSACRSAIEKQAASPAPPAGADIGPWLSELRAMSVDVQLHEAKEILVASVARISSGAPEPMARQAIEACRAFQAATWIAAEAEADSLKAGAKAQLSALEDILDQAAFTAAVEEVARDTVHARFPLVSAKVVWDRLTAGEAP